MKKPLFIYAFFLLLQLTFINNSTAQLSIDSATKWVSSNDTYVTLDNLGIQYNAAPALLANVFLFSGNNKVSIKGNGQPSFTAIVIAGSAGNKIVLERNIDVVESVNFKTGLFDLNNNSVFLSATALIQNESEVSRFVTSNAGSINITTSLNAPASANPGNLGAEITSSSNLGIVTIKRGHQPQNMNGGKSIARYYDILPANNSNLNATLRFHYFYTKKNGLDES